MQEALKLSVKAEGLVQILGNQEVLDLPDPTTKSMLRTLTGGPIIQNFGLNIK